MIPSIVARAVLGRRPKNEVQGEVRDWFDVFYREYYVSQEFYLTRGRPSQITSKPSDGRKPGETVGNRHPKASKS